MLIKPFYKVKEDIDDIENITQKNRYIFIYKYDKPHSCSFSDVCRFGMFNDTNNYYDIYLINDSQVHGVGFYIKKGMDLKNRNCYRGYCKDALTPDGKVNLNACVQFFNGTYLNRIEPRLKRDDPVSISTYDVLASCGGPGETCFEEEIQSSLGTDMILPFPQFYNVEDQLWLSNKYGSNLKIGDFTYDYSNVPTYTLRDLVDKYTKIAVIDIPSYGNIVSQEMRVYAIDPSVRLNNGVNADLEDLKVKVTNLFIDTFRNVSKSIFSAVDIIIDLECGEFTVNPLNCKFSGISKEMILIEKNRIAFGISTELDNLCELVYDVPDEIYTNCLSPNRLTMRISNYNSSIRLSNIYQNTVLLGSNGKVRKDNLNASGLISSSDSDDLVTMFINGIGG